MFVLARHAHAGNKHRWEGPDALRPLSESGRREATGLVTPLAGLGVRRLVSSPHLRCTQTLAPLAARTGLAVEASDLLRPDADATTLSLLLAGPGVDGTVYCTHGETLSALFSHWRVTEGHGGTAAEVTAKGAAWLVDTVDGRRSLTYLPPRSDSG